MDQAPELPEKIVFIEAHKPIQDLRGVIGFRIVGRDNSPGLTELNSFMSDIVKQIAFLEEKYPDARKYLILHAIAGSSVETTSTDMIYEDFPGEDSIEKFLKKLDEKYK